MQTKIVGTSLPGSSNVSELAVDATFDSLRASLRPIDYAGFGKVLGHYRFAGTGGTPFAPNAAVVVAALRNSDLTNGLFVVITELTIGISVVTAVTAQRVDPISAFKAAGYLASHTTNAQNSVFLNSNKMRNTMGSSGGVLQLQFANAAAGLTGGVRNVEGTAFSQVPISGIAGLNTGVSNQEIYSLKTHGGHPPVLASQEGIEINWGTTALATGTIEFTINIGWAEVPVY